MLDFLLGWQHIWIYVGMPRFQIQVSVSNTKTIKTQSCFIF